MDRRFQHRSRQKRCPILRTIARNRDLAMRIIFDHLSKGDSAVKSIVEQMDPMESYHERLFELLLADPNL